MNDIEEFLTSFDFVATRKHLKEVNLQLKAGTERPRSDRAVYERLGLRYVEVLGMLSSRSRVIEGNGQVADPGARLQLLVEKGRLESLFQLMEPWSVSRRPESSNNGYPKTESDNGPFWRGEDADVV